jgi:hypothetical protein
MVVTTRGVPIATSVKDSMSLKGSNMALIEIQHYKGIGLHVVVLNTPCDGCVCRKRETVFFGYTDELRRFLDGFVLTGDIIEETEIK